MWNRAGGLALEETRPLVAADGAQPPRRHEAQCSTGLLIPSLIVVVVALAVLSFHLHAQQRDCDTCRVRAARESAEALEVRTARFVDDFMSAHTMHNSAWVHDAPAVEDGGAEGTGAFGLEHVSSRATGAHYWLARNHTFCVGRSFKVFGVRVYSGMPGPPKEILDSEVLLKCMHAGGVAAPGAARWERTVSITVRRGGRNLTLPLAAARLACAKSGGNMTGAATLLAARVPGALHISGETPAFYHEYDQIYDFALVDEDLRQRGLRTDAVVFPFQMPVPTPVHGSANCHPSSHTACLPSAVAWGRGLRAYSKGDVFVSMDARVAEPTGGPARMDMICPETAIFWEKRSGHRGEQGCRIVRSAIISAVLGMDLDTVDRRGDEQLDVVLLRRPQGAGGLTNVDDVLRVLREAVRGRGFRSVRAVSLERSVPVKAQIEAAADAAILVSAHGAGLTHLNWQPAGACTLEIFPECGLDDCYRRWARARGDIHYVGLLNASLALGGPPHLWRHVERFRNSSLCPRKDHDSIESVSTRFSKCRMQKSAPYCWSSFRHARQRARLDVVQRGVELCLQRRDRDRQRARRSGSIHMLLSDEW